MGFFSRLVKHEALFQGMSEKLGVDFGRFILRDADMVGDYRGAVLACAACREGEACAKWQANHDTARSAPSYCRNKRLLESLRGD